MQKVKLKRQLYAAQYTGDNADCFKRIWMLSEENGELKYFGEYRYDSYQDYLEGPYIEYKRERLNIGDWVITTKIHPTDEVYELQAVMDDKHFQSMFVKDSD